MKLTMTGEEIVIRIPNAAAQEALENRIGQIEHEIIYASPMDADAWRYTAIARTRYGITVFQVELEAFWLINQQDYVVAEGQTMPMLNMAGY